MNRCCSASSRRTRRTSDAVYGEPARADAARDEIRDLPPAGWRFTQRWLLGYATADGELAAVADVVSDLLVPGVWHIGLFIVATSASRLRRRRGPLPRTRVLGGTSDGARWLRLGVVHGNARAERFWEAQGFVETRTRLRVEMGKRTNTLRVMVKPLPAARSMPTSRWCRATDPRPSDNR